MAHRSLCHSTTFKAESVRGPSTLKWIASCLTTDLEIHIAYITTDEYLETVNEILNSFALKLSVFKNISGFGMRCNIDLR